MNLKKLFLFLTLPLYVLDQVSKAWTVSRFPPPWSHEAFDIPVIENVFHLVRVHNQGVAFGFGNGTAWAPVVFLFVPIFALTIFGAELFAGFRTTEPIFEVFVDIVV